MIIRKAILEDAKAILDIYSPYVEKTAISFEYETPSLEDFKKRVASTLLRYPYFVAQEGNEITGYAYGGVFKGRAAYDHCCEISVYVRKDKRRNGVGKALYNAMFESLKVMGIKNVYAIVAFPIKEDRFLTLDSVRFHEKMGFTTVGHLNKCGFKFGSYYDVLYMEKILD
ncbi:MAG: N-acetyltransferase [Sphaerochaetaceae bacterium]|nr:N-acetyltransferase [Sphaerochaetaceae bacterium]